MQKSTKSSLAFFAMVMHFVAASPSATAEIFLSFDDSQKIADPNADFLEPSGLSLVRHGMFWAVSDNSARLFWLDKKGDLHGKKSVKAIVGLEGVAADPDRMRILAVKEDTSEILTFAPDGSVSHFNLLGMDGSQRLALYFTPNENNGLEGVTVNPDSGSVFVIKERLPRLLIEISPDLTTIVSVLELTPDIGFVSAAASENRLDVSGLAWDTQRDGFWIVSDTGQAVFFLDANTLTASGWMLMDLDKKNPTPVKNAEGVALGADGQKLYIVTDDGKTSRLLTFKIE